jgi:hypothetical protein
MRPASEGNPGVLSAYWYFNEFISSFHTMIVESVGAGPDTKTITKIPDVELAVSSKSMVLPKQRGMASALDSVQFENSALHKNMSPISTSS